MIKKASILVLIGYLFLVVLNPGPVQAQDGIAIKSSSAQAEFPASLNFYLSAESDADIVDIRLRYTLDWESFAQVTSEVYIEFEPASTVDINWTLDMVKIRGLPPGTNLDFWWVIENAEGSKIETDPSTVKFNDNRYPWQELTEGKVTLYWYEGKESFAKELMAIAQQALTRLATSTGAHLEKPARIYIYASSEELQGSMIHPQEWTGGVAFTRFNTLAIDIATDELSWAREALPHELTHLVIDQITLNPYGNLPRWLDEGLAMYNEGPLGSMYTAYLNMAIAQDELITARSLSSPFSAYAGQAALAYAQSYSLIEFLINNYGQGKMLELLNTFEQGSGYDEALEKVYGFDMDVLDILWRQYVKAPARTGSKRAMQPAYTGILTAFSIGPVSEFGLAGINRLGG